MLFFSANRWKSGSRLLFSEPESSIRSAPLAPCGGGAPEVEPPFRAHPHSESASSAARIARSVVFMTVPSAQENEMKPNRLQERHDLGRMLPLHLLYRRRPIITSHRLNGALTRRRYIV